MNVTFEVREREPEDTAWVNGYIIIDGKDYMPFTAFEPYPGEVVKKIKSTICRLVKNETFSEWRGYDHKKIVDVLIPFAYNGMIGSGTADVFVNWKIERRYYGR